MKCINEVLIAGKFELAEQRVTELHHALRLIENKYVLHCDAKDYEGRHLKAFQDKICTFDYTDNRGLKYLFIDGRDLRQVNFAKAQKDHVVYILNQDPEDVGLDGHKAGNFLLDNYGIRNLPAYVVPREKDYLVEDILLVSKRPEGITLQ